MGRGAFLRRLLLVPPTLFGVAVVVFVLLRVVPGNPVAMMIPPGASQADVDRLMARYGLDLPIFDQFVVWLRQVAGRRLRHLDQPPPGRDDPDPRSPAGDAGTGRSSRSSSRSSVGAGLALLGAYFRRRLPEWLVDGFVALSLAIPDFLWGLLFILLFGVLWPVLPISGRIDPRLGAEFHTGFYLVEAIVTGRWALAGDLIRHAILPAVALALPLAAIVTRVFKSARSAKPSCRTMPRSPAPAASRAAACCSARRCPMPPSPR